MENGNFTTFDYRNIPQAMKLSARWICFQKDTKRPINIHTGTYAKTDDNKTWGTYGEAYAYYLSHVDKIGGLAFMLGDGFIGIDLDNHIDKETNEKPMSDEDFKELVGEFTRILSSYSEYSLSGDGVHIICRGILPEGRNKVANIEMYSKGRYFCTTGNAMERTPLEVNDRTNEITSLFNKYLAPKIIEKESSYDISDNHISKLSDDEVIDKIKSSKQSELFYKLYSGDWQNTTFSSQSDADLSLTTILCFWCNGDADQIDRIFRKSGLMRSKWDEKRGAMKYGEITIEKSLNSCTAFYDPEKFKNKAYLIDPNTGEVKEKVQYELDDTGNAKRYYDKYFKVVKYNTNDCVFMVYDSQNGVWERDTKDMIKVKYLADQLIEEMRLDLLDPDLDTKKAREIFANIKHLSSSSGKKNMLEEVKHMGFVPCVNNDFDQEAYLLCTLDGVVNLKNGELLKHSPEYMCSKSTYTHIDFKNEPKLFTNFIYESMCGNIDMINYLQKAIGYTIAGNTIQQVYFTCVGKGNNGKSVLFNIMSRMMGTYACNLNVESLLDNKNTNGSSPTPDIAEICGSRFVRTNEPKEGAVANEGLLKQLSGGDPITARKLFGSPFKFYPVGKLWIACNNPLIIRGTNRSEWRRIVKLDFNNNVPEDKIDTNLENKLISEIPSILGWYAVQGCIKWQVEGLKMPEVIKESVQQYRTDMDVCQKFIDECCMVDLNNERYREQANDLFKEYQERAKLYNEYAKFSITKFGIEMTKHANSLKDNTKLYDKKNIYGKIFYIGIRLKKRDKTYKVYSTFEENKKIKGEIK